MVRVRYLSRKFYVDNIKTFPVLVIARTLGGVVTIIVIHAIKRVKIQTGVSISEQFFAFFIFGSYEIATYVS